MFEFYDMYTIRIYTAKKKKSWSLEILIQKAPLPLVRNHSVSYGRFKRRLVDSVESEQTTIYMWFGSFYLVSISLSVGYFLTMPAASP